MPGNNQARRSGQVCDRHGFRQDGIHAKRCDVPVGNEAKVGVEFDCRFTGPEGPYTAHMRVTKVDGENVEFAIDSKRG